MKLKFEMKSISMPGNTIKDMREKMQDGGAMAFADPREVHPRSKRFVEKIAVWNELGREVGEGGAREDVPPRPALKTMMRKSKKHFTDILTQYFRRWLDGQTEINNIEYRIGKELMERLKTSIREWRKPANKPATIRRKGFNNPLTETGLLERSIKWRSVRSRTGYNG